MDLDSDKQHEAKVENEVTMVYFRLCGQGRLLVTGCAEQRSESCSVTSGLRAALSVPRDVIRRWGLREGMMSQMIRASMEGINECPYKRDPMKILHRVRTHGGDGTCERGSEVSSNPESEFHQKLKPVRNVSQTVRNECLLLLAIQSVVFLL